MTSTRQLRKLLKAKTLLTNGDAGAALELTQHLLDLHPDNVEILLFHSRVCQQLSDFDGMLDSAKRAAKTAPGKTDVQLRLAECLLLFGKVDQALLQLDDLIKQADKDVLLLSQIGDFYTACGQHEKAFDCYQRCLQQDSEHKGFLYNAAAAATALGKLEEAEALYDQLLKIDPGDFDAWQNRSTVRKQTPDHNHVKELKFVLGQLPEGHAGRIALNFALAKELEDLQDFEASFAHLQAGAIARRAQLQYEVSGDEDTMRHIENVFDEAYLKAEPGGSAEQGPLFILGLPRSGTTLLNQMLASHSQVDSLGEINTLALAITRLVGPHKNRTELIEKAALINPDDLANAYLEGSRGFGKQAAYLIDKTPLNFLYIGLLRRALPNAKILHLRRHPVDSCYAVYKTLFRMGYPFSYSLQDMGRYYMAYHALMGHWRRHLPDYFLDVDYEQLVTEPEQQLRRVLSYLQLPWEDACLDFSQQAPAAATASSAQVREPVYTTSVARWKCYQRQLMPLANKLKLHGIPLE